MKLRITLFSILLTFSLFAQGPPRSQGGRSGGQGKRSQKEKPSASKIIELLDVNGDYKIDREEALKDQRGKILEDFDVIDTNEDGYLDVEEIEASLNDKKTKKISVEKIIKLVDDNGDGTLNKLEVAAKDKRQLIKEFDAIDVNKDNELDLDELNFFLRNSKEE
jgi:Ca2+-binding EF-hand superfamily protein